MAGKRNGTHHDLEDRLVCGVIIDLEGIDDKQTGTSRAPLTTAPVG